MPNSSPLPRRYDEFVMTMQPFLDRLVLIGNHRDAWTYGAGDPSSGTAAMMETARILGNLKKQGKDSDYS